MKNNDYNPFERNVGYDDVIEKSNFFNQNSFYTGNFVRKSSVGENFTFGNVTNVLPIRTTTVDYQIDRKHSEKWNFNLPIG